MKILPAIVNHFEKTELADVNSLIRWLEKNNKKQHKYHVEGVGIQLESGDLVRVPIFLFVEPEQEFLRPGLDDGELTNLKMLRRESTRRSRTPRKNANGSFSSSLST